MKRIRVNQPGWQRRGGISRAIGDKFMNNAKRNEERPRELGAISIKALGMLVVAVIAAFLVIKIAPVYVDERQVTFKVEDLANKSAVRNSKEEVINKAIEAIRAEYDLPEHSISLVSRDPGRVQISVNYQRTIDLLVTTYEWKVAHTAAGKDL
jgi:hypothetical protein